jgi:hypothetical protein
MPVCGLFSNAVNNSYCTALNTWLISMQCMRRNVEVKTSWPNLMSTPKSTQEFGKITNKM